MKQIITEYKVGINNITEKKVVLHNINEFDVGNAIKNIASDKGSLLVGNAPGVLEDLPVGLNGTVLTADSTQSGGIKWLASAGGGGTTGTMTNRSGVQINSGAPVIMYNQASSITTTTIAGDRRIIGVASEDIPDGSDGEVTFGGVLTVLTKGAVNVGQWLVTNTNAGYAKGVGYTKPIGSIGIALTADAGPTGSVTCLLDIDWYLSISAGKGYLQGNLAASTLNQILNFITETTTGGAALPASQQIVMGLPGPSNAFIIATASAKTPYATDTPATSVGTNLVTAEIYEGTTGIANSTKGIVAGGYAGGNSALAEKVTFSTETIALAPSANLSAGRYGVPGVTDTNNGYFVGGYTAAASAVGDKVVFATDTTSAVASTNLSAARNSSSPSSNVGVFGYFAGGSAGTKSNIVDKLVYSTDTTAVSTALATAVSASGGSSSGTKGFSCGGSDGLGQSTNKQTAVEAAPFATDTWAAVGSAALPTAQTNQASCSTLS